MIAPFSQWTGQPRAPLQQVCLHTVPFTLFVLPHPPLGACLALGLLLPPPALLSSYFPCLAPLLPLCIGPSNPLHCRPSPDLLNNNAYACLVYLPGVQGGQLPYDQQRRLSFCLFSFKIGVLSCICVHCHAAARALGSTACMVTASDCTHDPILGITLPRTA